MNSRDGYACMRSENSTVEKLSDAIYLLLNAENGFWNGAGIRDGFRPTAQTVGQIRALMGKYRADLPLKAWEPKLVEKGSGKMNVVLAGSTGFLGHYILEALLGDDKVGNICCFYRGADGEEMLQAQDSGAREIDSRGVKARFLQVYYDQLFLGGTSGGILQLVRRCRCYHS